VEAKVESVTEQIWTSKGSDSDPNQVGTSPESWHCHGNVQPGTRPEQYSGNQSKSICLLFDLWLRIAEIFEIDWDMDQACILRTSDYMLQALDEVVERPAGFCCL
jgi:hypothetical protein